MTNGVSVFAFLYCTEVLRIRASLAGIALAVPALWQAFFGLAVGHWSDRTHSRLGRRRVWMTAGGFVMALAFLLLWTVPLQIRETPSVLFAGFIAINLTLRTGLAAFSVPYTALGFEIYRTYDGQAKLQAVREVFNMAANLAGPSLAWSLFFSSRIDAHGHTIAGTSVAGNFVRMGTAFALVAALCVGIVLWSTHTRDTTGKPLPDQQRRPLLVALGQVVADVRARPVLIFIVIVCVSMVVVSSLMPYIYVYFMRLSSAQRFAAHATTAIGMGLGAAISPWAARRFDKKAAALLGAAIAIGTNLVLYAIFIGGIVARGSTLSFLVFTLLHGLFWVGNGILLPTAASMLGDAAESHRRDTGVNRAGIYSAALNCTMRLAISAALFLSGWLLSAIGFRPEGATPEPATWRLGAAMFLAGAVLYPVAMAALRGYPPARETPRT